ncbi:kinase-like domain-containing protein [Melanogaster broomeanus]|nr:kinase-like domain-containing protein [Melanogaster broomeanus]
MKQPALELLGMGWEMDEVTEALEAQLDPGALPDLTNEPKEVDKHVSTGGFGTVYHYSCRLKGEVAVKAFKIPDVVYDDELAMKDFERRMRREHGIWRRLDHPNIVPLLGTADGSMFKSEHPCMVSMWMLHGTLRCYIKKSGTGLAIGEHLQFASRLELNIVNLITWIFLGVSYVPLYTVHAKNIVHGDLHPGNVLIDGEYNARLTDFDLTQVLGSLQGQLAYLQTATLRPGAVLSGELPWPTCTGVQQKLKEGQSPQQPESPAISDAIWNFIQQCWSPLSSSARPSAQEVFSFVSTLVEHMKCSPPPQTLPLPPPNSRRNLNAVLFGKTGVSKSSVINLLAGHDVAKTYGSVSLCTLQSEECAVDGRTSCVWDIWDTVGLVLPSRFSGQAV